MFIIAILEGLEDENLQTADRTYRQNFNKSAILCEGFANDLNVYSAK
ncbi:hypothetical protein QUB68_09615 [Microcoleus sp. A006_D1]